MAPKEWALHRLMTIGEACRAMIRESLRTTLTWAIEQVTGKNQPVGHVVAQLGLTYSGSRLHDTQSGVSKPAEDVLRSDLW
jgi:hypothetical protein